MVGDRTDAPSDDLVERLTDDADWLRGFPTRSIVVNRLGSVDSRGLDGIDATMREAAARIRSLEAQRDQAVGLLQQFHTRIMMERRCNGLGSNVAQPIIDQTRAFLDSLKEGR